MSWVMWVMGQLTKRSQKSWVGKMTISSLSSEFKLFLLRLSMVRVNVSATYA